MDNLRYIGIALTYLAQILIMIMFFFYYLKRENNANGYRDFATVSTMALFIWITALVSKDFDKTNEINFVRLTLLIIDYTLMFFGLTLTKRLERETQTLKRIEIEKKKATRAEEEEKLIKDSENVLGNLKTYYDNNKNTTSFPKMIQLMMFTNTVDLPHRMMPNSEFHKELKIIHPILEEIYPIASKLKSATNLSKYNENSELNEKVYEFFTDGEIAEFYGLPISTNYVDNPLLKLLRGSSKGIRGENRLEKELLADFKGHPLFFNLHLTDGENKIELDALMIIGNNVITFESKHYTADKILFEENGQAKIFKNGKSKIIDVVSQMNRHHNVIQNILGDNINVYSMFVLTDKKTLLQNSFTNKYFKVSCIDSLGFMVKDLDLVASDESEEFIYDLIKDAKIPEREFNNVDLIVIRKELQQLTSLSEFDSRMNLEYLKTLDLSPLNKAENNIFKLQENNEIYNSLFHIIKNNIKDKRPL